MISWKPNHIPKASPPNTITLEIRASTCEFSGGGGEDTNVQSTAEREAVLMIFPLHPQSWTASP